MNKLVYPGLPHYRGVSVFNLALKYKNARQCKDFI